ncbi:MAG: hypothetical protein ACE5ER_11110 [Nitrospinaceae bacterium]
MKTGIFFLIGSMLITAGLLFGDRYQVGNGPSQSILVTDRLTGKINICIAKPIQPNSTHRELDQNKSIELRCVYDPP